MSRTYSVLICVFGFTFSVYISKFTFQALLTAGETQAPVCTGYATAPVLTDITLSFRLPGVECSTYLGSTAVCFNPLPTETKTCDVLSADTTYAKVSCKDLAGLKAELVIMLTTLR